MKIIPRKITEDILKRFKYRNIIAITGARQTGKTTLCRKILPELLPGNFEYFLFDDPEERIRFKNNGIKILENLNSDTIILDEVQKIPAIFEQIKYASEKDNSKKFIITGSSHLLLLNNIKETLAGRISVFNLFPFSIFEVIKSKNNILDKIVFSENTEKILKEFLCMTSEDRRELISIAEKLLYFGGFPKVWNINDENEKFSWLKDYKTTFIERDLIDIGGFVNLENFIIVQKLLALRTSQLLNISEVAKEAGVSVNTVKNYLNILKLGFQSYTLTPFFANIKKRIVKSPKLYFVDNGVLKSILGREHLSTGALFENFVFSELLKWKESTSKEVELFFFRTSAGFEVDFIIKTENNLIPIEVKSGINVDNKSARNIKKFLNEFSTEAKLGLIIYKGKEIKQIEKNIIAIPFWFIFS
jgi:predicted AAA+ superfamily ATPase